MSVYTSILLVFLSTLTFSCTNESEQKDQRWHLVKWYGTIAGISKEYPKGTCIWDIEDDVIKIQMNVQDSYIHSLTSRYTSQIVKGEEEWQIDSLGTFTKTVSNDSMYLRAPCCDMIDYTLVKD